MQHLSQPHRSDIYLTYYLGIKSSSQYSFSKQPELYFTRTENAMILLKSIKYFHFPLRH